MTDSIIAILAAGVMIIIATYFNYKFNQVDVNAKKKC